MNLDEVDLRHKTKEEIDNYQKQFLSDLYQKMLDDKFVGHITLQDDCLMWELPNGMLYKIYLNLVIQEGYIVMIKYDELNSRFFTHRFPEFAEEIHKEVEWLGQFLPHCIFGDILNEKVVDLLKKEDYLQNGLLQRIFGMYEDFAVQGDEETQNLLEVTLLEYLWDEKVTYERALELMGVGTKRVWDHIQGYLRIPEK